MRADHQGHGWSCRLAGWQWPGEPLLSDHKGNERVFTEDIVSTAIELLKQGRREEMWRKYCGFLELSLDEFMDIQGRLLMEQVSLLSRCELGRRLFGDLVPASPEEFREIVPLTTYDTYRPFLENRAAQPGWLPSETSLWARTSGRSSEYTCKWSPYSRAMVGKIGEFAVASFILASCSGHGDIRLDPGDVCLYTLAPAPYFTGAAVARGLQEQLQMKFIPPLEAGDRMEFEQRIREGFRLALTTGIDFFYGLSSVLRAIAEQFQQGSGTFKFSPDMLNPGLLYRVANGLARSKISRRGMLPRDLWKIKGIVAGGMDTSFYSAAIEAAWGRKPLEGYGGTELGGVALQAWNYKGMSFLPDCNFLEFIAESDFYLSQEDPAYQPGTYTLADVQPGVCELVITNFHGGVFTRYRTGDLIEIVALRDDELGTATPQMKFHARADGVLDVGGFTRLTEKSIFQAIVDTCLPYVDWTARKEYVNGKPRLHIYLELSLDSSNGNVKHAIHDRLAEQDPGYAELESMLGIDPLMVTVLPRGAFVQYREERKAAGAELAHLKPPRMNAPDAMIQRLLRR